MIHAPVWARPPHTQKVRGSGSGSRFPFALLLLGPTLAPFFFLLLLLLLVLVLLVLLLLLSDLLEVGLPPHAPRLNIVRQRRLALG